MKSDLAVHILLESDIQVELDIRYVVDDACRYGSAKTIQGVLGCPQATDYVQANCYLAEILRLVQGKNVPSYLLVLACSSGHTSLVKLCLQAGLDPSKHYNACLSQAVRWNYVDIAEILLSDSRVEVDDQIQSLVDRSSNRKLIELFEDRLTQ
ncbi:Hypothetical protein POVR2_LOCUS246 [uncultured virus]|nr:Hypothetical protein POVR2_LOCUS246 [uncultured virus]